MAIIVRLGGVDDVEAAASVYESSNLVRRHGLWPDRAPRLEHVRANLRDPAGWFLVGYDGRDGVAMASALPFRADRGAGPVIPGTAFLDLIYVAPDRWGEGIGGLVLDRVIAEAAERGSGRLVLWTHEEDNERAQRLYAGRGFRRSGVLGRDEAGEPTAEWVRDGTEDVGSTPAIAAIEVAGIEHRVVTTRPADSPEESAELQGIPVAALLRTLVVRRGDDDYVFVLVPGGRRFDWPKLRSHLGVRRLSMPDGDEARAVTGYERGAITPFGASRAWPVIADATALEPDVVAIGGGARGVNVHLRPADLLAHLAAEVADVSVEG